jgi:hypothetical protein
MGLFGSIKKNLSHGGVKLELQAPAHVSMQDTNLPVSVTITAGESGAHIKSVTAEIFAQSRNMNFQQPTSSGLGAGNGSATIQTVARAQNVQPFDLAAGQTQTVQLSIVMNAGAAMGAQLPEGSAAAGIMHGLQQLQSIGEALNSQSYSYFLKASADVEGVALDPSKQQPLQILKPGQFGGGFNINL